VEGVVVGELGPDTDWSLAIRGIDVVIHLAARVHVMHDSSIDAYDRVNVSGSRHLAETAALLGVKRLVFVSSVKAMGEASPRDFPWTEEDECSPEDSYGKSKLAAELALHGVAGRTNLEVVILRPPVVYGPEVTANIYRLLQIVDCGWPLPLGSVENRRSFIYVGNFADAIVKAIEHPKASGETFLVSDGKDISTSELIKAIARALGKPAHIFPMPTMLLEIAGRILGKSDEVDRLLGSLVVNSSKISRLLGWQPPLTIEDGLVKTVQWYRERKNRTPPLLRAGKEYSS